MNATHKLCKKGNRLRRIDRRITELYMDKAHEVQVAEKNKRDPVLHEILSTINRLKRREKELEQELKA